MVHLNYNYPTDHYEALQDYISFEGFSYAIYYYGEQHLLQPQLEAIGYINVTWLPGEQDDFGPLSRVCRAEKDGKTFWFSYG